jgi:scyllo-inositol 2-dehydrogenase (NADP+)
MEKKIRAGLVGFGMSGRVFHAPFLHTLSQYDLVAVVERHKNEAEKIYPYIQTERSLEQLLLREDIDLVIITTPNETHFPYAQQALQAGKHVVLEKPFANTTAEAQKLITLGNNSGSILSVYHNRRYVGDFKTIQQIVEKGLLGEVHEYICHFDRYRDAPKPEKAWREEARPGSGVFFDLGPHLIDQALCLFGLPLYITAFIKQQRSFARVDDYFEVRLDYDNGLTVILKSGMLVREMGPRYAVHGTVGSYLKFGDDPQEELLKQGIMPTEENWGMEPEAHHGMLHTVLNGNTIRQPYPTLAGNFGAYYIDLYQTIAHGKPLYATPEHGYNTIRLIELAQQSNKEKRSLSCNGLLQSSYSKIID